MYCYSADIQQVIERLLRHNLTDRDHEFVMGVWTCCDDKIGGSGLISYKQLQHLGRIYKKYVQRGVYINTTTGQSGMVEEIVR